MSRDKTSDEPRSIPIVQEEAFLEKRLVETGHVRVRTSVEEEPVLVRDTVSSDTIEVRRVAVDRQVDQAPPIREEDGVTIIPVIEERLIVEKRLFLIEEIHLVRTRHTAPVELPTTLRRTRVHIDRTDLSNNQEDTHGST